MYVEETIQDMESGMECCAATVLQATFEGTPLVSSQGLVTVPDGVPDGAEIH